MYIKVLEKSELSSVIFIRDYLQFVFEGDEVSYTLTSLIDETVVKDNIAFKRKAEGWRDALCSLINMEVIAAFEEEGVSLKVIFLDGNELHLSLIEQDKNLKGTEAAHFKCGNEFVVWHSA